MHDAWESGDPYEYFMGRWSRLVARKFIEWLTPPAGLKWLDVGCGSGALSAAALDHCEPVRLTAVDQSAGFVAATQQRLGARAECKVGNALALPLDDDSVNVAVSGLVLNFIPQPEKALAEMKRVTALGGVVAVYIWDYAGTMDFLNHFWDAAAELDSTATAYHEGRRFPDANGAMLQKLFTETGFTDIAVAPIEIETHFADFEDYWQPFLGGQGPAPTYLLALDEADRTKLYDAIYARLPVQADGSIPMVARAWAVKGHV